MIKIRHLKKSFPLGTPLVDVNVDIHKGDIISIIGPSGTGKSTLIRCINLLEKPTAGEIWVDGECITDKKCEINKVRQKMGMVFQSFNLFDHMTVIENVMAAPVDLLKKPRQEAYDQALSILRSVGLADRAFRYPDELSGGQKQRVAIARALAMEPQILLLDEPTSALDPTNIDEVQVVIRELAKKGLTMMIVTHEMKFAKEIANRVFYMDDGGIYEDGTPDQIFNHPQKEKTIRFIKRLKVFEDVITSKDFDYINFNISLEDFCNKNQMPQLLFLKTLRIFEELAVHVILPEMENPFKLSFTLEYSQEKEEATIFIKYDGKHFNINDSENSLSLTLAKNAAKEIHYETLEGEYTNSLTIKLK